jgi:very-short-patch-repair endonuclease
LQVYPARPVGPYFADFLCREKKLAVEIDGVTHSEESDISYDARRTTHLEGLGYRVLRVWNIDVFTNMDDVLESILLALDGSSSTDR